MQQWCRLGFRTRLNTGRHLHIDRTTRIWSNGSLYACTKNFMRRIGLSIFSADSSAVEPRDSWEQYNFHLTILGQPKPATKDAHKYKGEGLVMTTENAPALLFICMNGKFRVSASTTPQDLRRSNGKATFQANAGFISTCPLMTANAFLSGDGTTPISPKLFALVNVPLQRNFIMPP